MKKQRSIIQRVFLGILMFQLTFGTSVAALAETVTPTQNTKVETTNTVKSDAWYEEELKKLLEDENAPVLNFIDNKTNPKENVSVGEFVALLTKLYHSEGIQCNTSDWLDFFTKQAIVDKLVVKNEFSNYNNPISRGEAARLINRFVNQKENPKYELWHLRMTPARLLIDLEDESGEEFTWHPDEESINRVFVSGIMGGYPNQKFKPYNSINRGEVNTTLKKLVFKEKRNKPIYDFNGPKMKKMNVDVNKRLYGLKPDSGHLTKKPTLVVSVDPVLTDEYFIYKDFLKDFNIKLKPRGSRGRYEIKHESIREIGLMKGAVIDDKGIWYVVDPFGAPKVMDFLSGCTSDITIKYIVFGVGAYANEAQTHRYNIVVPVNIKFYYNENDAFKAGLITKEELEEWKWRLSN